MSLGTLEEVMRKLAVTSPRNRGLKLQSVNNETGPVLLAVTSPKNRGLKLLGGIAVEPVEAPRSHIPEE